jgi:Flp pilus assembly pilin Flp
MNTPMSECFHSAQPHKDTMNNFNKISFTSLRKHLRTFHEDTQAATSTEYIILLILIACFVIAIVKVYGTTVSKKFRAADQKVVKDVTF